VAALGTTARKKSLDIRKTPRKLKGTRRIRLLGRLKVQGDNSAREGRAAASRCRDCGGNGRILGIRRTRDVGANEWRDLKRVTEGRRDGLRECGAQRAIAIGAIAAVEPCVDADETRKMADFVYRSTLLRCDQQQPEAQCFARVSHRLWALGQASHRRDATRSRLSLQDCSRKPGAATDLWTDGRRIGWAKTQLHPLTQTLSVIH